MYVKIYKSKVICWGFSSSYLLENMESATSHSHDSFYTESLIVKFNMTDSSRKLLGGTCAHVARHAYLNTD